MKQFCFLFIVLFFAAFALLMAQDKESLSGERVDLERFTGLYGDPDEKNETSRLWVMISCDGYLVSGALWGGVGSWWMTSEADNIFTYEDSFTRLRMEFETDENGKGVRVNHDLEGIKTPLELLAPIPEDWGPCLERPKR